jgi:TM2 domain-containing membrane protein YozV
MEDSVANVLQYLPALEGEELAYVKTLMKDMADEQAQQFAAVYGARRKDPQTILILTIVGFIGVAGVQRFMLNQIGMGLLYLLTAGLCWIGTIIDLVNFKKLTFEFNQKVAHEVSLATRGAV